MFSVHPYTTDKLFENQITQDISKLDKSIFNHFNNLLDTTPKKLGEFINNLSILSFYMIINNFINILNILLFCFMNRYIIESDE